MLSLLIRAAADLFDADAIIAFYRAIRCRLFAYLRQMPDFSLMFHYIFAATPATCRHTMPRRRR